MDSETSDDQSNSNNLSSNEDCESENDRSNGSPQLAWDESYNEVTMTVDRSESYEDLHNTLHDLMNDTENMTEGGECELHQVYPTAKFEYKRVTNVSGEQACELSAEAQACEASTSQVINLYSLTVNDLHNTENIMRDMFEISRLRLYVPDTQIIVAEDTKNYIMSVNPYRERKSDILGDRLNSIFSFIWDSAALTILKATSPRM